MIQRIVIYKILYIYIKLYNGDVAHYVNMLKTMGFILYKQMNSMPCKLHFNEKKINHITEKLKSKYLI